jgi:putative transposase
MKRSIENLRHTRCECKSHYVSTVGRDEAQIREYIQEQEKENQRLDQLNMFK